MTAELKKRNSTANSSGAYQGGLYWKYCGEILTDIRERVNRKTARIARRSAMSEKVDKIIERSAAEVSLYSIRNAARSFGVSEEVAAEKLGYSVEEYEKMKVMCGGKENSKNCEEKCDE